MVHVAVVQLKCGRTVEAAVALSLCDLVFGASTLPRLRGGINSAHHGGKDKQEEEKKRRRAFRSPGDTSAFPFFHSSFSTSGQQKNVANGTRHINIAFAFRGVTFSCAPYQPKANIAHFRKVHRFNTKSRRIHESFPFVGTISFGISKCIFVD